MDTLRDNPEVIWGFLLALAVVLLLTPGVGRFARYLGVVDEPGDPSSSHASGPAPGRDRAAARNLRAGARLPRARRALSRDPARGRDRDDGRGDRRLPRPAVVGQARRPGCRRRSRRASASRSTASRSRFGSQELPEWAAGAATIVWVVAIMNMVNFLDGMDGLAAGICAIAGSTFAIIGLSLGAPEAALLSAIVAGACFGFLHHNFYPARIFMGDSGALLLGFLLATLAIEGLVKTAALATLVLPPRTRDPDRDTSFVVAKRLLPPAALRGRPHAPPPPVHEHRLLAEARGRLHVRVVRDPGRGGALDPLPSAAPARRVGSLERVDRRRHGAPGARGVRLHRLPSRDHQARQPAHPPARGAGKGRRALDPRLCSARISSIRRVRRYKLGQFSRNHAGFRCYKLWYARPGMERALASR